MIKILTYNLGIILPFFDYTEKINKLLNIICEYDIIVFQEILCSNSRKYLLSKSKFKYYHYFNHGPGCLFMNNYSGTGMFILSKYPIVGIMYKRYSINGKPHKILHLDYMIDKGIGLCYIKINNEIINLYMTHLHANYSDTWKTLDNEDEYKYHRLAQLFELSQFIKATMNDNLNILCGDLNCDELSNYKNINLPVMTIINTFTNMKDCLFEIFKNKIKKYPINFSTFLGYNHHEYPPQRLDYIFFNSSKYKLIKSNLIEIKHLSDHAGISAVFDLNNNNNMPNNHLLKNNKIIKYLLNSFDKGSVECYNEKIMYIYYALILLIILIISLININLHLITFITSKLIFMFIYLSHFNAQKNYKCFVELHNETKCLLDN